MKKQKFILSDDLIVVEKEPDQFVLEQVPGDINKKEVKENKKVRMSLDIDNDIKMDLQIYCIRHKKTMTEIIEERIRDFLHKEKSC